MNHDSDPLFNSYQPPPGGVLSHIPDKASLVGGGKRRLEEQNETQDSDDELTMKRRRMTQHDNSSEEEDEDGPLITGVDGEVIPGYSDDDDDMDEEEEENEEGKYQEEIEDINREHQQNMMNLINGTEDDLQEFNKQFAEFTPEDWDMMANTILNSNMDWSQQSDKDVLVMFQLFYQLFCYDFKSLEDVCTRTRCIYPNMNSLKDQYKRVQAVFGNLHIEMYRRDMLDDDKIGQQFKNMLTQITCNMKLTYEQMVGFHMIKVSKDKNQRMMLEEMTPFSFFQELDRTKLKKHQQLLHYYYNEAFKDNLRRDGDSLYRPRYNQDGEFVHAYEYVYDVADFVFTCIYPIEQNRYWFDCLTEKGGTASICINMLGKVKSEWLPILKRNRDIHAFRNGLYILSKNTFYYFRKRPGKRWVGELANDNLIAIKFHDQDYDEENMTKEMDEAEVKSYMSIKMDAVHQILSTQNFSMDERRWILGLLGRMLFKLGKHDTWGIFPYFLGLAGTGKSTLLRLFAHLYEPNDVGYLSNALQRQFALEGIFDKLVYFALDIDEHFQLDQATFQSMVVAEEVAISRKFKKPLTMVFDIPGAAAGNKLPPWEDNGGSLARRLVVIEFLKMVTKCDPNLFAKCLEHKDRFLKVITSAYEELYTKYSANGIKEVIPKKFRQSEKKALMELNALSSFIVQTCEIDEHRDEDADQAQPVDREVYLTQFKNFNKAFKDYCKRNSIRPKPLVYNYYNPVFAKFRLSAMDPTEDDPHGQKERYILGIRLKESALQEEDGFGGGGGGNGGGNHQGQGNRRF